MRKPSPVFYKVVLAAAGCPAGEVLSLGGAGRGFMAFPGPVVLSGAVRVAGPVVHQSLGLGGRCRDLPLHFRAQARTESDGCPAHVAWSRALTVARRIRRSSHAARARAGSCLVHAPQPRAGMCRLRQPSQFGDHLDAGPGSAEGLCRARAVPGSERKTPLGKAFSAVRAPGAAGSPTARRPARACKDGGGRVHDRYCRCPCCRACGRVLRGTRAHAGSRRPDDATGVAGVAGDGGGPAGLAQGRGDGELRAARGGRWLAPDGDHGPVPGTARLPDRARPPMDRAVKETPESGEHAAAEPAWQAVARYVCALIADGALRPGQPVPSGAELSRRTGHAVPACRQALRDLAADGVLTEPVSVNGRARVAGSTLPQDAQDTIPAAALSGALARQRRAAGLTQPDLAALLGVSVTAVGHAETGRLWQSRDFWLRAGQLLGGNLAHLHDEYTAAKPAAPKAPAARLPARGAAPARSKPVPPEPPWAADAEKRARGGESMASIARVHGVGWDAVKRTLDRRGVPNGREVPLPEWAADAKTRYEAGEPAASLADLYDVSHDKVRSVLRRQDVEIRNQRQARDASAKHPDAGQLPAEPP